MPRRLRCVASLAGSVVFQFDIDLQLNEIVVTIVKPELRQLPPRPAWSAPPGDQNAGPLCAMELGATEPTPNEVWQAQGAAIAIAGGIEPASFEYEWMRAAD